MHARRTITRWYATLKDPATRFSRLHQQSLESLIVEYLTLLCLLALVAGVFIILLGLSRAAFYALFLDVGVNEWLLTNYILAGAVGGAFFALFAGTFLLFVASMLASAWYRDLSYVDVLRASLVATTPLLFFGWIVPFAPAFAIWSLVLFFSCIPVLRAARKRRRGTIGERE